MEIRVKESRGLIIKGLQSYAVELTLYPEGGRVLVRLTRMSLGSDGQLVFLSLVAMRSMYGTEGGWVRTVWGGSYCQNPSAKVSGMKKQIQDAGDRIPIQWDSASGTDYSMGDTRDNAVERLRVVMPFTE